MWKNTPSGATSHIRTAKLRIGTTLALIGTAGMLEVKCPYWRKKDGSRVHKAVPAHYYMQINMCLEICQIEWCGFISWTPEGHAIYHITADHVLHEQMLPHYVKFFGAMQRMAKTPNPLSDEEKTAITEAVAKSMEAHIDYKYWATIDPSDSPPSNDEEEPAPKRVRIDEAKIVELGKEEHATASAGGPVCRTRDLTNLDFYSGNFVTPRG